MDAPAVEVGGFLTGRVTARSGAASDANGDTFLFRPFLDVDTGNVNAGSIVALPGALAGGVSVSQTSALWGTHVCLAGNTSFAQGR